MVNLREIVFFSFKGVSANSSNLFVGVSTNSFDLFEVF
jgi:hypothetical protein